MDMTEGSALYLRRSDEKGHSKHCGRLTAAGTRRRLGLVLPLGRALGGVAMTDRFEGVLMAGHWRSKGSIGSWSSCRRAEQRGRLDTLVPGGARVNTGPLTLGAVALLKDVAVVVGRLVPHAAHDIVDVGHHCLSQGPSRQARKQYSVADMKFCHRGAAPSCQCRHG